MRGCRPRMSLRSIRATAQLHLSYTSAHAHGRAIQTVDDQLAPGCAVAEGRLRNPTAAAEPRIIEVAAGPGDPDAFSVRQLVDVGEPGTARVVDAEGLVDPEADVRR